MPDPNQRTDDRPDGCLASRRRFLAVVGAGAAGLAGCGGSSEQGGVPTGTGTTPPTRTEVATPTRSPPDGQDTTAEGTPSTRTEVATPTRSPPAAARDTPTEVTPTSTPRASGPRIVTLREAPDEWTVTLDSASGTGETDVDPFTMPGGLLAAVASYDGDGEFTATLADNQNGYAVVRLFRFDGAADGSSAVPVGRGEYYVDIQTSGSWSLELVAPRTPERAAAAPPFTVSGTGYATVGVGRLRGETTVTVSHDGTRLLLFVAREDDRRPRDSVELFDVDRAVEDERTTASLDGRYWFVVKTDGSWTVEVG